MDEQPKVSVIIPVYNTEAYLREAVESVMQQTLHEIEIIIVNDGSTDGCSSIIDELASKDKRIHPFVQENQGQSIARNNGMLHAEAAYCYFMDSDDILRKEALLECYQTCEAENLDFVYFDADIINECQSTSFSMDYHHDSIEEKVYDGSDILNYLIDTCQLKIPPYLFFIRKQYLLNNDLHFFPGIIHEDELFTMLLYLGATRVKYIGKEFFLRRIREASTMTKRISWRNVDGYFTVFRELGKYAAGKSPLVQTIIIKYIKLTLNAFLRNAHEMTMVDKLRTCGYCLSEGLAKYISLRVFIRFLMP